MITRGGGDTLMITICRCGELEVMNELGFAMNHLDNEPSSGLCLCALTYLPMVTAAKQLCLGCPSPGQALVDSKYWMIGS